VADFSEEGIFIRAVDEDGVVLLQRSVLIAWTNAVSVT
jgi:hypothetical protein